MLPKIVTGWQSETSEFLLNFGINPANVLSIDGEKLPVNELRDWLNFCDNLSRSDSRYVLLLSGVDLLSIEAQNILLKPLEEKKDDVEMYLLVGNENKVLPTIISRCEVVTTKKMILVAKYWLELLKLWRGQPADILAFCETFPIEDLNIFLTEVIARMKLEVGKGPTVKRIKIINVFLQTCEELSVGNVNKKMALENLLLKTWRLIKT